MKSAALRPAQRYHKYRIEESIRSNERRGIAFLAKITEGKRKVLMQLTDFFDWQSAFDRTTLEKGRDLYDAGKAKKLTVDEEETALTFRATVRTERNYRPVLRIDQSKGKIDLRCDCEEAKTRRCVHMAALFLWPRIMSVRSRI